MLTNHQMGSWAFAWEQFHKRCPLTYSVAHIHWIHFWNHHTAQEQWNYGLRTITWTLLQIKKCGKFQLKSSNWQNIMICYIPQFVLVFPIFNLKLDLLTDTTFTCYFPIQLLVLPITNGQLLLSLTTVLFWGHRPWWHQDMEMLVWEIKQI